MSEIPEDLITKAETVWLETWENYQGDHDADPIGVIAKAIYAERLRCAEIAERAAFMRYPPFEHPDRIYKKIIGGR